MPQLEIDVSIESEHWNGAIVDIEQYTHGVVASALSGFLDKTEHADISIVLADDSFVQNLNKIYRHKDRPTNVLSFPQTELDEIKNGMPMCSLGDIIIAFETIKRESQEQKKTIQHHFTHMLVHGCLHLLHFDHETDEDAEVMERREIEILKTLGIKNPYEI